MGLHSFCGAIAFACFQSDDGLFRGNAARRLEETFRVIYSLDVKAYDLDLGVILKIFQAFYETDVTGISDINAFSN